ncbi:LOW QUALITY PROTEIN: sterol regulatory element-binding protein cleavage-activating protein-like [Dendronephthya gigantea]|uniref:LOW QUALITY PROTEIN: sterol regulatory element-binding protein cleavage-activating protein-like n=1 Tax=Dendronephthya gigantea TaxID=151771 RepID=UPI00106B9B9A|nr:LOW QUALITY PROTEIN: sterol regulatory element-binding protein cleavage-activating protein-like [Dendronephthya gigantea]
MQQAKVDEYPVVSERNLLERIYYYHGLFCAKHPGFIIFICGVLIFLCSGPIITYLPLTVKIPSEWNETTSLNGSNSEKPNWLKEKPAAFIQQVIVTILIEPVNNTLILPYGIQEAFKPVFKIVHVLNEHKHTDRNKKRVKLSDLCFLIRHRDSILLGEDGNILPKKGCLQISPASLWKDVTSFQNDKNILGKIYGKPSKNIVSLKENIFGVPLRSIGLFPLAVNETCLVIRYAVTTVLRDHNPSFTKSLKKFLLEKFPQFCTMKSDSDSHTIVHIHYEGDNIIEIYHLCFTYFMVFIYLVFSVSKIEMVKSKLGLAFSAVVTVVASLSMAAGLCIFFGMVPSVSSSEIFPYLVIIIGLENILVITRSIVSTHPCLPVPIRVAEGLSREGRSITLNLTTELLLLLCGYLTFVPGVQEFCMVGGVGVLTDFFLQIVFFATVLSIDLGRLEHPTQSPHIQIPVPSLPPTDPSDKKPSTPDEPEGPGLRNWRDVFTYFYNPMKIFSLRQDLPRRLNFAYFWARTRIVQRGIMIFAIIYLLYITSTTIIYKDEYPTKVLASSGSLQDLANTANEEKLSEDSPNVFPCKKSLKTEGLWRNLSRQHWPELLDLYGVNVMDRYISVLPPINLQYKVENLHIRDPLSRDSENISKFYQDISKDLRWTSHSYAVELAGFVKILYLITAIFMIVLVYLIYQLLSTRPRYHKVKKFKPNAKSIMLLTSPIFLDGHQQNIECVDCSDNVIVSSCLEGSVRVWDSKTTECISVVERKCHSSRKFGRCIVGKTLLLWDVQMAILRFGTSSKSALVFFMKMILVELRQFDMFHGAKFVISRLNGFLEFIDLGDRFSENSSNSSSMPSMRKKMHSNPSSWKTIMNSVSNDHFPSHSCRAHGKTISVISVCKDLVISGSVDNLLKVFRSQTGVCLFTLRGHTTPVTALTTEFDGNAAISGSADGEIRSWSLISGESNRFAPKHSTSIVAIVSTPSRIATLDITEMLCVWDRFTRNHLQCLTQFPGGCLGITPLSNDIVVCVGKDTMVVVGLIQGHILRVVELEQRYDRILINHVLKCDENSVVCDYGEKLVLLTFHESENKNS